MKQRITAWMIALRQRQLALMQIWNTRTAREQNFMLGAGVTIAAALFYLIMINPALEGRSQLQRTLPQLRLQAAQLHAMADDVAALPAAVEQAALLSRQKLESTLRQHGLKAQSISISGDGVHLQFEDAPFAQLLECLATLQKTQQLAVSDASFSAQNKPGMVNANLQLSRQKNE